MWHEAINPIRYTGTQVHIWVKSAAAPPLRGAADACFGTSIIDVLFLETSCCVDKCFDTFLGKLWRLAFDLLLC